MSLRWKAIVFVCGVTASFGATAIVVQQLIMRPGFEQAERAEALDDLVRCTEALRRDAQHLSISASDYSVWDSTVAYVHSPDPAYIEENFLPETYRNLGVNMVLILDAEGRLVWGEVRDHSGDSVLDASQVIAAVSRPGHVLTRHPSADSNVAGVWTGPLGPMLVASRPITASDGTGPVHGAVVMGRFLDEAAIVDLGERTRVQVACTPIDPADAEVQTGLAALRDGQRAWLSTSDPNTLRAYAFVDDVSGAPALLMRVDTPQLITKRGQAATNVAAAFAITGGTVLMLVMWFVLTWLVVDPLTRVTAHAVRVGKSGDLAGRLNMTGSDEIGILAHEFDRMVDRVRESRAQMVDVARHAGMAQVATDVLHNVGNVLNTVNVSAGLVSETLRKSETPTLQLAAQLLRDHEGALDGFFNSDERGRQLPAFLSELAAALNAERESMLREMQNLSDSIEHIRRVVDMQQSHGRSTSLIEPIDPAVLVEQACALSAASFGRHTIRVVKHLRSVGLLPLDRHKVLQILVNLLRNAKQALVESTKPDRRIEVSVERGASEIGDVLRISIADNGVGIPPENLVRVFNFGFSTRRDGHGFGLHGAANLAREMNGTLQVASDGPGCGATFTLELPLVAAEVQA